MLISNISRLGGGVSSSAIKLAQALRKANIEPVVFSAEDRYLEEDRNQLEGVEIVSRPQRGPAAIGYIPGLLADAVRSDIAVLHLHGIWQYPSIVGQLWKLRTGRPYIVSPHGMLENWILDRGRTQKWLAKLLYEKTNLTSANLVHALTRAEADQIRRFAPQTRTVVIPNGIDVGAADIVDRSVRSRSPYILYLGRLHPKKNVETAIQAWHALGDVRTNYRFVIAGWGADADVVRLAKLLKSLGPGAGIDYVGSVYGREKERLLGGAQFVILPSLSEGLPMTILEAWTAGAPTLMSSHCNLLEGFAAGASLDCGTSAETIQATLARALALSPEEHRTMSEAARDLANRKFSVTAVTETWAKTYRGLLAPKPADDGHRGDRRPSHCDVQAI